MKGLLPFITMILQGDNFMCYMAATLKQKGGNNFSHKFGSHANNPKYSTINMTGMQ
jgi:hypothetical protein